MALEKLLKCHQGLRGRVALLHPALGVSKGLLPHQSHLAPRDSSIHSCCWRIIQQHTRQPWAWLVFLQNQLCLAWAQGETLGHHKQCELHHRQPALTTTSGEYLSGAASNHTVSESSSVHRQTVLSRGLVVNWDDRRGTSRHRDVRSAAQFALLTSLCVLVHLMPFPPASAHNAPRCMLLHLTSHFYFTFFHLSSLLPLPFLNVMQPFLPCFLFIFFFLLFLAQCRM